MNVKMLVRKDGFTCIARAGEQKGEEILEIDVEPGMQFGERLKQHARIYADRIGLMTKKGKK